MHGIARESRLSRSKLLTPEGTKCQGTKYHVQASIHHDKLRAIFSILATLIWTRLVFSVRAQEVLIPDPGLNAAIREALQNPAGL
jgi:hypothetical protein